MREIETSDQPVTPAETLAEPAEPLADATSHEESEHIHLPPPSIWPITSAFGFVLIGFGLVTAWYFWVCGMLITGYGVISWIQELRHEPH